jgi:phospholipase/carboxylesterase
MAAQAKMLRYRRVDGESSDRFGMLLHGFGADARDLQALTAELDPGRKLTWLLPDAPVSFQDYGFPGGNAWFPGSVEELSQALFGGYFSNLSALDPPGLQTGAILVRNTFRAVAPEGELVVLAGFSQGAMIATEALLSGVLQPQASLLFSGALIAEARWRSAHPPVRPRVFQSHGRNDPILSYRSGEALRELLESKEVPVHFQPFAEGHVIPPDTVSAAAAAIWDML